MGKSYWCVSFFVGYVMLDFFFLSRLNKKNSSVIMCIIYKKKNTYDSLLREDSNPTVHLQH